MYKNPVNECIRKTIFKENKKLQNHCWMVFISYIVTIIMVAALAFIRVQWFLEGYWQIIQFFSMFQNAQGLSHIAAHPGFGAYVLFSLNFHMGVLLQILWICRWIVWENLGKQDWMEITMLRREGHQKICASLDSCVKEEDLLCKPHLSTLQWGSVPRRF